MTWLIGALVGAALGVAIDRDAWLAGAIVGGVIGWLFGRKRSLDRDDRFSALERRLQALERRLDELDRSHRAAAPQPLAAAAVGPGARVRSVSNFIRSHADDAIFRTRAEGASWCGPSVLGSSPSISSKRFRLAVQS